MLNTLEGFDLRESGYGSSRTIHLMAEAMRRAYRDRAEFLGDPAFVEVPVARLTSKEYAAWLAAGIDPERSTPVSSDLPGLSAFRESPSTTHISVADREGFAVSMTQSINYSFGSGVTVPGTGVLLNNTMDDFSAKPGVANVYGLVGSEANAVAPGKIPLSSMTPTIVTREGALVLVAGSPGGSTIINTVLQVIINTIDHGMDPQAAVDMPKVHHQWLPDELRLEPFAAPADVRESLEFMGHKLAVKPVFGNAMAIGVDARTGDFLGGADARGVGSAVGVAPVESKATPATP
jgi:gamma-glutamyltranspeptidase/glutathione hydrolase